MMGMRPDARESEVSCPLRATAVRRNSGMVILVVFRWAKKRIRLVIQIRFL
jgi:hypothetical protein